MHSRPVRCACLSAHIRGILTFCPAHVDGVFDGGKLVDVGGITARLLDDAALLGRQVELLFVAELGILDNVGRTVGVVDNFTLKTISFFLKVDFLFKVNS